MIGQQKIDINEQKPSKLMVQPGGYEVVSNDGVLRIQLRHEMVMDGSMESDFYATTVWVKEGDGWIKTSTTQSYRTKEEFIRSISDVEDFSEAMAEFNS